MFLQNADGSDGMYVANDHIKFDTSSSERMRIDSSGNIGINTANAEKKLGIKTATNTNERAINIYSGTTTADNYVSIGSQYSETNGLVNSEIRFGNENTAGANSYLAFATGDSSSPTERMRIDSAGDTTHIASYGGGTMPFRVGYGSYASFTPP